MKVSKIPFLDLGACYAELAEKLDAAALRAMRSASYVRGAEVEAFEKEFAAYCEADYCVGVGNGLDAIELILRASGIGPGDEVIVPSHTFIATWLAVSRAGAVPIPAEPDSKTYNLDPASTQRAISARTKAIIAVHLYGQPADMDSLALVARRRKILLIEDAAQAHGARYKGSRVGGLAAAAAFSFYPGKNLGAMGDAGAVVTRCARLAKKVRALANYGARRRYFHETQGSNSRLDEVQAAILRVKLQCLDEWNSRRCLIAAEYQRRLAGIDCIELPQVPSWAEPVWHIFAIRVRAREALRRNLAQAGVGTLVHYPIPPHLSGAYRKAGRCRGAFPIAERISQTVLSLPMGPHLSSSQAAKVADLVLPS
jgi:dTDP-4-amino-4,6-dideoxygalactose transaminase